MKTAIATLKSQAPYSQSRPHDTPKLEKEIAKDYEERTWRERAHINQDGQMFIPPMAFKNCLDEAAKYMSIKYEGKKTYTKHFEAGVMVTDSLVLPFTKETMGSEWVFVPSDGQKGGSKRVWKHFPVIQGWNGDVTFYVFDDIVTESVFRQHLEAAGQFIGLGRFRPRNRGFYGRYSVENIAWSEG